MARPRAWTWRSRRLVQTGFLLTCLFIGWQFVRFIQVAYMRTQAYEAASEFYDRIAEATNDPSFRISPDELRREAEAALAPPPPAAEGS